MVANVAHYRTHNVDKNRGYNEGHTIGNDRGINADNNIIKYILIIFWVLIRVVVAKIRVLM